MDLLNRKYFFDDTIFDRIDNAEKAYWLGFIYADGGICKNSLRIELHKRDINHLKKLKKFFNATYPIRPTTKDCFLLCITSKQFIEKLVHIGIIPRKTYLSKNIPPVPEHFKHHLLRGIFDGDGWITNRYRISKKTGQRLKQYEFGFSNYHKEILTEIHTWINSHIGGHRGRITHRKKENQSRYELHFGGNRVFFDIYKILFQGLHPYLERKFCKITNAIKDIVSRKTMVHLNSKLIKIDDTEYQSMTIAENKLNLPRGTIGYRIHSPLKQWSNYNLI